jgi:hypothetical protein
VNPTDDPLTDWRIDRAQDYALCPEHAQEEGR